VTSSEKKIPTIHPQQAAHGRRFRFCTGGGLLMRLNVRIKGRVLTKAQRHKDERKRNRLIRFRAPSQSGVALCLPPHQDAPATLSAAALRGRQPAGELSGSGESIDYSTAVQWLQKGADQGLLQAGYELGSIYEHGMFVPKDESKAVLYENICKQARKHSGLQ